MSAHIVLVGLPGAGKSTVGPAVARRLNRPFLDLDDAVSERAGRSVAEIIRTEGEAAFRTMEHDITAELVNERPGVVSPGGGWITRPRTVALIRPPAKLLYLMVSPEVALRRLGRNIMARPLLDGEDPRAALEALAEARHKAYEAAEWVVNTESLTVHEVIHTVVELVSGYPVG